MLTTILLSVALLAVFGLYLKEKKTASELPSYKEERDRLQTKIQDLGVKISALERYQGIVDADDHAKELVAQAESDARQVREQAKSIRDRSESILSEAHTRVHSLIATAEQEAQRIAGDAYEAMKSADSLEKTVKAMRNIIEGYGDQYIVPTHSLLDHLAEDFTNTKAGEELKLARANTRAMIKNGTAAQCEYVEANRKEIAINFVLDAFNGKVDTILASVKDDNFGTLEQKIKDAFVLVNFNGAAFRNARITEFYLTSRLAELKLASTVQAIKEQEREEQRQIREQIREEEKAAREYEKAIKEAQKEEEMLAKALEKARKDLESANEQQKMLYEEKMKDLQAQLIAAGEKNKRAISMAQQTKTGHVYIISNVGSFGEDVFKIGMTRRLDPMDRIYELGDASVPFDFDVHAMILSENAPTLEYELHRKFEQAQINKVNLRKEFFKVTIAELRTEIESRGVNVHWTMLAQAKEFRESQTLSRKSGSGDAA